MTSAPAIGFDYRPPRLPARLLAGLVVLAAAAVALSGVPRVSKLPLVLALIAIVALAARRTVRSSVIGVALAGERWTLYRAARSESAAVLVSFRIVGTCVLLRLKDPGGLETVLLAPDNSDADLRRRLRMRLTALPPTQVATRP